MKTFFTAMNELLRRKAAGMGRNCLGALLFTLSSATYGVTPDGIGVWLEATNLTLVEGGAAVTVKIVSVGWRQPSDARLFNVYLTGADWSDLEYPVTGPYGFNYDRKTNEFQIRALLDNVNEPTEQVTVSIIEPQPSTFWGCIYTGHDCTLTFNIINSNAPTPEVSFVTRSNAVSEEASMTNVEVRLSFARTVPVSVNWDILTLGANWATYGPNSGEDYITVPPPTRTSPRGGTLTFAAGQTTTNISVRPRNDSTAEAPETVHLVLSGGSGLELGFIRTNVVTIIDDDQPPIVSFRQATSSAIEHSMAVPIEVILSEPSSQTVTVNWAVDPASLATAGNSGDYLPSSGTITFTPPATSALINLTLREDSEVEQDETVILNLTSVTNGRFLNNTPHTLTIVNDDAVVTFPVAVTNVLEAPTRLLIPVRLSQPLPVALTVDVFAVNGDAYCQAGLDYLLHSTQVTFGVGATETYIDVSVLIDTLDENDEFVNFFLQNPSSGQVSGSTRLTILDNDPFPSVAFTTLTSSRAEGQPGSSTIEVRLSAASGRDLTVRWAVTGGTAGANGLDYSIAQMNGVINFEPGRTTTNLVIDSLFPDTLYEGNETVVFTLSNPFRVILGGNTTHTFTILEDDPIPTVHFPFAATNVAENVQPAIAVWLPTVPPTQVFLPVDGIRIPVRLSHASAFPATVAYASTGGSASNGVGVSKGGDYRLAPGTLNFPPHEVEQFIEVIIENDLVDEPNQTIVLTLGNPTGAQLDPRGSTPHTVTILDDDAPPQVNLLTAQGALPEGNDFTVQVRISPASEKPVTVPITAAGTATGGANDYDFNVNGSIRLTPPTLTFAPGESTKTFGIRTKLDSAIEGDETVVLGLGTLGNALPGTSSTLTLTILDDDVPRVMPLSKSIGYNPGHRVRLVKAGTTNSVAITLDTVDEAELLLAGKLGPTSIAFEATDNGIGTINYVDALSDPAPQGRFGGDRDIHIMSGWPGAQSGTMNHFAMDCSGYLYVPQPGNWIFTVRSDDGFRLSVGVNNVVLEHPGTQAATDRSVILNLPEAGYYPYRLIYFEAAGGAQVEFYAHGPGQTNDQLVGSSSGILQVYQDIDLPPVMFAEPDFTPLSGFNGHNVQFRKSSTAVDSVTAARALFALNTADARVVAAADDRGIATINYLENGPDGLFTANNRNVATPPLLAAKGSFSTAEENDYAMLASGYIYIPEAGFWTFGVHSDDGFELRFGRALDVIASSASRAAAATTRRVCIPEPGYYRYELIYFEWFGGAEVEFYASGPGQAATLVGDPAGRLLVYRTGQNDFPTAIRVAPESDKVVGAAPGHQVRFRKASQHFFLGHIGDAEALLSQTLPSVDVAYEVMDNGVRTINYVDSATDPGQQGVMPNDRDIHVIPGPATFSAGDVDNFAMEAVGVLYVPQAGNWLFSVVSDDGFRLSIGFSNQVVLEEPWPRPAGESRGLVYFPEVGYYRYQLTYFEASGGAQLEWLARPPGGSDQLVGAVGSALQVFQYLDIPPVIVPEPDIFVPGSAGHRVEFRKGVTVTSLHSASNLLAIATSSSQVTAAATDNGIIQINYLDAGSGNGVFASDRGIGTPPLTVVKGTFSSGDDNGMAMRSSGYIYIPAAGVWNFTVLAQDGFRLSLGRYLPIVKERPDAEDPFPLTARVCVLAPGYYHYDLLYFNSGAAGHVEFYASGPGQTSDVLVGANTGTLRVYQTGSSVPLILSIQRNGNSTILQWPAAAQGYQLEWTDDLLAQEWQPLPGTPSQQLNRWTLTDLMGRSNRFYRLRK